MQIQRIGNGYDAHRLVRGRRLVLGGVDIPFEKGLLGHSDADVLVHAVIDALLGATGCGDIGTMFPDTSQEYRNAYSIDLLRKVNTKLSGSGYSIVNIDSIIVAQKPKLLSYICTMKQNIARALDVDVTLISVKATTEEGMGFTGTEEGIAAYAVCLLTR